MKSHSFLVTYWLETAKVFRTNLLLLQQQRNTNALHDLRVAVKKLRATLELYIQLSGESLWENPLRETETLFKTVARERDLEICTELLRRYRKETAHPYTHFLAFLSKQCRQAKKWSAGAFAAYRPAEINRISGFLRSEENTLLTAITPEQVLAFFRAGLQEASGLNRHPHRLRRHLKKMYYWMRCLPSVEERRETEKRLNEILDGLGDWQDRQILLQRLRHYRKDYLPETFAEQEELKGLRELLEAENRDRLRKVSAALKKMKIAAD